MESLNRSIIRVIAGFLMTSGLLSGASLTIVVPEAFQLLSGQRFDLRIEVTEVAPTAIPVVTWGETDLGTPDEVVHDQDRNLAQSDTAWVWRGVSRTQPGESRIRVSVDTLVEERIVSVRPFELTRARSLLLFIGDAMGTAYRDAARIVGPGSNGNLRGGRFHRMLAMDKLPVTGMVLNSALDRLITDSGASASALATGSKAPYDSLSVLPDNNDWRFDETRKQSTASWALDNPRIESLASYLKRLHGYRVGVVTNDDVVGATPAAHGTHTRSRDLKFEIAASYLDQSEPTGPVFDLILGGGAIYFRDRFDGRDLVSEFKALNYTHVTTASQLKTATAGQGLIGLFRPKDMTPVYDRLGLMRPTDEEAVAYDATNDEPSLVTMTRAALRFLRQDDRPFLLMVEGDLIDGESHDNHAVGTIWSVLEFDHAVAEGRKVLHEMGLENALMLVLADHDQSMQVIGVTDTQVQQARTNYQMGDGVSSIHGEVTRFPDYVDEDGDGYPENENRYRLVTAFSTDDHTATAVPVSAEGQGAFRFTGYQDNTDLFFKLADVLGSKETE